MLYLSEANNATNNINTLKNVFKEETVFPEWAEEMTKLCNDMLIKIKKNDICTDEIEEFYKCIYDRTTKKANDGQILSTTFFDTITILEQI